VVTALILLGIVPAVMQLESDVLQSLLLGWAVKLHPLAMVLAIAAGLLSAGITNAAARGPAAGRPQLGIRSLRSRPTPRRR
jgi:putative heme transporter